MTCPAGPSGSTCPNSSPNYDARLSESLVPFHRWDHRDARGVERGKSPRDTEWHQRIYSKEELAANSAADGNTGIRIPHGWIIFDYDSRNTPEGRDVIAEFQRSTAST